MFSFFDAKKIGNFIFHVDNKMVFMDKCLLQ